LELDGVRIGTADLEEATAAYALLLGGAPVRRDGDGCRFQLERGAIDLVRGTPGPLALHFVGAPPAVRSFHGLEVVTTPRPEPSLPALGGVAIDHVVVRTPDPERAIALWRDRLGLRLALDRAFPERGLRLVFFRSAGLTLEFAAGLLPGESDGPDRLHGVSYRVTDLAARRERLVAAGVEVSAVRPGMRPGTSVVSVRSGVPTLLLQAS
jgi:catechol 2,3-dioxygenase-like lactoylglutathione lyase family enzyme